MKSIGKEVHTKYLGGTQEEEGKAHRVQVADSSRIKPVQAAY